MILTNLEEIQESIETINNRLVDIKRICTYYMRPKLQGDVVETTIVEKVSMVSSFLYLMEEYSQNIEDLINEAKADNVFSDIEESNQDDR